MNKKVNLVFMGLVVAVVAAFLAAEGAEAFCVYNKTDKNIFVDQTSGGDFNKLINPDRNECCNWQTKDCNEGGKRDSTVRFDVHYRRVKGFGREESVYICNNFSIKAGGWLTVEGSKGDYKCVRHDY